VIDVVTFVVPDGALGREYKLQSKDHIIYYIEQNLDAINIVTIL